MHVAVWHNMIRSLQYMVPNTHYRIIYIYYYYFNCIEGNVVDFNR